MNYLKPVEIQIPKIVRNKLGMLRIISGSLSSVTIEITSNTEKKKKKILILGKKS